MKYYLRNLADQSVTGPFELDKIEAKLEAGELPDDTLATGDIGESLRQVRWTPAEDWMPVRAIPGFGQPRASSEPPPIAPTAVPAQAPPPPAELFPTHVWKKAESPPTQFNFCPFCGQSVSGAVVPGETCCEQCGRLLNPTAEASPPPTPVNQVLSSLRLIVGAIGGLVAEWVSFVIVCAFAGLGSRKPNIPHVILFAVLVCAAWIAIAIPMLRSQASRGFAFGILLGVGLTALLTATCAVGGVK